MRGLVRFELISPDLFGALIAPRYDVLPLIRTHFERRYADQQWLIYDARRQYGLYWNRKKTEEVRFPDIEKGQALDGELRCGIYPRLWQKYFQSITIPERRNPKLHFRQLPRRYWQYLPEKRVALKTRVNE